MAEDSRGLLNFVLDVTEHVADVEPAALIERLQQHRPAFLNLLKAPVRRHGLMVAHQQRCMRLPHPSHHRRQQAAKLRMLQGPNAESRRQVESLQPATADGPMRLDPGDAHEALLLADALQLDELVALGCLQAAHDEVRPSQPGPTACAHSNGSQRCGPPQRGEASAEVAAGLWLEQRRALVGALHRLLQSQALPAADAPPALAAALAAFNADLLGERAGGRSVLLGRLIDLLKARAGTHVCANAAVLSAHACS